MHGSFLVRNCWLVPFFPLAGAVAAAIGGKRLGASAHIPVVIGIGLAFLVSLGLLGAAGADSTTVLFDWMNAGGLRVPVELRVDGLSTMMLSMVTFVATLVAVFAVGYMAGDPAYPRFFACVGLFVFMMTGLVLSNNYVLTYVFWEGVGVCSYLLIGFWYAKPAAAAAAKKAFLVNRVGDFGFAIAIFWLWTVANNHDLSYSVVLDPANLKLIRPEAIFGISLLLLWAATAKSAQVPLYVWLPDAMEGPTPVSALIHAATMVTAGVYLIARSMPMISSDPRVLAIISLVGGITAALAAAIAITQTDLKRVMAYSTVSQLGYMFMALGAGVGSVAQLAVVAAMFHLFTHAFFKALLFLSSGSVMHAMGGVIDMRKFGGLRRKLPVTCATFAVGGLALAGVFPFAGFWSKDEILAALKLASEVSGGAEGTGWGWVYGLVYWVAVVTAGLTALYTGRAFFLTFFGPERLPTAEDLAAAGHGSHDDAHTNEHGHGHDDAHGHDTHIGHESPLIMTFPLVALATCAVGVGLLFGPTGIFEGHLEHTLGFENLGHAEHGTDWNSILIGTFAALFGLALSYPLFALPSRIPSILATRLGMLYRASLNKFYIDEIYAAVIVAPLSFLAQLSKFADVYIVDGLVRLIAKLPRALSRSALAPYQNGLIQFYAAAGVLGLAALLAILLLI